jgi:hypothetical protein
MGVSGQRHAPAALYPRGEDPRYPLYSRLGGPQSRSRHRGQRKNPLPLPGIELDLPVVKPVARHYTELTRLTRHVFSHDNLLNELETSEQEVTRTYCMWVFQLTMTY